MKFARFNDEILAAAATRGASDEIQLAADVNRRSSPAVKNACASIEVVVVLPCVPETPIAYLEFSIS